MISVIRRLFSPLLIAFTLLLAGQSAHAGVPVIDGANLFQAMAQVEAWGKQFKQMKDQLDAYQKQYNDLRANPFGTVLKTMGGKLPTSGATTLTAQGWNTTAYGKEDSPKYLSKYNPCQPGKAGNSLTQGAAANACEAMRNMQAGMMNDLDKQLLMVQAHENAIENLLTQASGTKSPGELQAIQIRLTAYNGILQADLAKIQLSMNMYQQRAELYKRQLNESIVAMAKGNGGPVDLAKALKK